MSTNETLIVGLVTVIHVATLIIMIWIRVRRTPGDGLPVGGAKIDPCALCGEPATTYGYDGLDPDEQRDPHTGKIWSADLTHYRPVCEAHERARGPAATVAPATVAPATVAPATVAPTGAALAAGRPVRLPAAQVS